MGATINAKPAKARPEYSIAFGRKTKSDQPNSVLLMNSLQWRNCYSVRHGILMKFARQNPVKVRAEREEVEMIEIK